MAKPKEKITDHLCKLAYVRAYAEKLDFNHVFQSNEINKLFLHEALIKHTKPKLVFGNLLPAISILMAPGTQLKITETENEYKIKPNIFLLMVCISGGGKSQAFNNYLLEHNDC
uniref:Uncharacterized protein n=1 Tax=Romanomermis culicivorax TaxID=13658 RepID=A0A915J056_ROMCU